MSSLYEMDETLRQACDAFTRIDAKNSSAKRDTIAFDVLVAAALELARQAPTRFWPLYAELLNESCSDTLFQAYSAQRAFITAARMVVSESAKECGLNE